MEHCRPKIMICFTIALWSIFLLKDSQTFENQDTSGKWLGPPSMDIFENYGDMQKYIDEKNAKNPNKYPNPLEDSYINAYNYHHESPVRLLVKRETTAELVPKIFKFGVEDAREPDEETKELIRKHRARELREKDINFRTPKRTKRNAPKTEPKFIKFDVSDAREPDAITKELIRQSRARELRLTSEQGHVTTTRSPKSATKKVTRKRKRTRRSPQMTQPQFIKFELADAKEPNQNMREILQSSKSDVSHHEPNETQNTDDSVVDEDKKFFFYHAAPTKSKRIANSVPIEVKKIIDLMIRDSKAQALYKYITANQGAKLKALEKVRPIYATGVGSNPSLPVLDNLITIYPEPAYVQKLVPIPVPIQTIPINALPTPSQQHPTGPAPHTAIIPATTHNHQFYHPTPPVQQSNPGTHTYQQPPTYLKVIPAMTQVFKEIPTAGAIPQQHPPPHPLQNSIVSNEILKPYPYAKIVPLDPSYRYGKSLNFYPTIESQQIISANEQSSYGGDITNQSQQKFVNQNSINEEHQQTVLKHNHEFQELSSLIGKSPTDQIHGLAYLLAKEMQRNKRLKAQRPQDNTSPILFHPEKNVGPNNPVSQEPVELPTKPEFVPHPISEPLPHTYPPAIQQNSPRNHIIRDQSEAVVPPPPPPPPPTSYNVVKNPGLSPNYQGIDHFDEVPKIQPDVEDGLGLQYASKYAFGYRVRDFHSGNDFGHKQNRDLDGVTRGQYHILLPDGRVQNVIYHADDTGFHADVSFETGHR